MYAVEGAHITHVWGRPNPSVVPWQTLLKSIKELGLGDTPAIIKACPPPLLPFRPPSRTLNPSNPLPGLKPESLVLHPSR